MRRGVQQLAVLLTLLAEPHNRRRVEAHHGPRAAHPDPLGGHLAGVRGTHLDQVLHAAHRRVLQPRAPQHAAQLDEMLAERCVVRREQLLVLRDPRVARCVRVQLDLVVLPRLSDPERCQGLGDRLPCAGQLRNRRVQQGVRGADERRLRDGLELVRDPVQRQEHRDELRRRHQRVRDAGEAAREVRQLVQQRDRPLQDGLLGAPQQVYGRVPLADLVYVGERAPQPLAQKPLAHGRLAAVQQPEEAPVLAAVRRVEHQLQVLDRRLAQQHAGAVLERAVVGQRAEGRREPVRLEVLHEVGERLQHLPGQCEHAWQRRVACVHPAEEPGEERHAVGVLEACRALLKAHLRRAARLPRRVRPEHLMRARAEACGQEQLARIEVHEARFELASEVCVLERVVGDVGRRHVHRDHGELDPVVVRAIWRLDDRHERLLAGTRVGRVWMRVEVVDPRARRVQPGQLPGERRTRVLRRSLERARLCLTAHADLVSSGNEPLNVHREPVHGYHGSEQVLFWETGLTLAGQRPAPRYVRC